MNKKILIVCSETNLDLSTFNSDAFFIIGVERGCMDLINKKIRIDLAISDFDSVTEEEFGKIKQYSKNTEVLNPEKDFLDGEMAIIRAKEISDNNIIFIAKPSKRYDMNFSAINLVNQYNIKFINDETIIIKLSENENKINFSDFMHFTYISFFATTLTKITLSNFKYNVSEFILKPFENKCISNALVLDKDPKIISNKPLIMIATR